MNKKYNANLVRLVSLLNDGEYHDGNSLGDKLKMTRSAVWKLIKKLQQYEIKLSSIKGKGYALQEPLILLDKNKIKHEKVNLEIFESIDSTNAYLSKCKYENGIHVCLSEQQTKGRGRFQREWCSPFAKNIYLSCHYPFQKDVSELSGLSLVVSLAIIRALKDFGVNKKSWVKWPNDIVYDYQKLSGSLIEIQAETHGISHAIIGIGMNVNMMKARINQGWTSMQKILGVYVDRNKLCAVLLDYLFDYLQRFDARGLGVFVDEWNAVDCLRNKMIAVTNADVVFRGEVKGINVQGHLILELEDGKIRAFSSGDTSVVK